MKLSDVCEFIVDCPHSTAPDEGAGYPLIRTPNIGRGRLNLNGVHRVSEKIYLQRTQRGIPQKNDLILAREAPAGNVAIIKNEGKVCLGQRTVLIRPLPDKANPDYLTYYLLSPQQQYNLLGTANGATVAHVNLSTIRNLKIQLPPINIQCHIVDILSVYDDLIEVNQKQIRLLEEAARRLYREWFVDLRFPGHEDIPITDGIPAGWTKTILNEIVQFRRGKTITQEQTIRGSIPVIAGGREPAYFHNMSNTEAPVITVSASGANAGFTQIHYQKIWASDCSFADDTSTSHLYFAYCFLKQSHSLMSNLQKGSAQPHVYAKDINHLPLLLPPQTLIQEFENAVIPFFHASKNCLAKIKLATEARDRLLPKLMNGEIEV